MGRMDALCYRAARTKAETSKGGDEGIGSERFRLPLFSFPPVEAVLLT